MEISAAFSHLAFLFLIVFYHVRISTLLQICKIHGQLQLLFSLFHKPSLCLLYISSLQPVKSPLGILLMTQLPLITRMTSFELYGFPVPSNPLPKFPSNFTMMIFIFPVSYFFFFLLLISLFSFFTFSCSRGILFLLPQVWSIIPFLLILGILTETAHFLN